MELFDHLVLFCVGAIAGIIGINVGGGGLITIPGLLFLGLPPTQAIATNQFATLGVGTLGWFRFNKLRQIDYRLALPFGIFSFLGAILGARSLLAIPENFVGKMIAILMLLILVLLLIKPKIGTTETLEVSFSRKTAGYGFALGVGFWGAFFGGGYITFGIYTLVLLFGRTFLQSAAILSVSRVGVSVVSLFIYGQNDIVHWSLAPVLICGCGLGSYTGASIAVAKGNTWIRMLLVLVVVCSSMKLLFF